MGKKISNFTILTLTIFGLGIVVIIASIVKISDNHNHLLMYSMQSQVEYYAKRCYLENNCVGEVTLKDLYDRNYIKEEVVDPVSKEILDDNIKINFIRILSNFPHFHIINIYTPYIRYNFIAVQNNKFIFIFSMKIT